MVRLVFVDVDGTLVGPEGVPPCAWEAAERARALGVRLVVCTGRPGAGRTLAYARRLDPEGLHIFQSGAVVLRADGTPAKSELLPRSAFHRMVDLARALALPLEAYTAEGGYYAERASEDLRSHAALLELDPERLDLHGVPAVGRVVRVQWVVRPKSAWRRARAVVLKEGGLELHEATSPATPGVLYASITRRGVSKLAAARWVAAQYGLTLRDTAMVGDGENDLELIRAVGLGIAMGNAPEAVRRAADRVVGRVEDCGLAQALELLLGERL